MWNRLLAVVLLLGGLLFGWLFWVEIVRRDPNAPQNAENYVERKSRHLAEEIARIEAQILTIIELWESIHQTSGSDENS